MKFLIIKKYTNFFKANFFIIDYKYFYIKMLKICIYIIFLISSRLGFLI